METIRWTRMESPVGELVLAASERGLAALEFERRKSAPAIADGSWFRGAEWKEDAAPLQETMRQLREYFAGTRREFTVPLDLHGPEFHMKCWRALLGIPYGETRSYAEIARKVGSPEGFRAVGQANHHNPVAIIVPCHRVLNSNGGLSGYGGGLETKRFLLKLEGARCEGGGAPTLFDE